MWLESVTCAFQVSCFVIYTKSMDVHDFSGKEKNMDPKQAVKYSFNTVGAAIVITSVALSAGFAVLAFSGFYVNFSMGVLTVIAIIFALLTDFLFLPALLIAADNKE